MIYRRLPAYSVHILSVIGLQSSSVGLSPENFADTFSPSAAKKQVIYIEGKDHFEEL